MPGIAAAAPYGHGLPPRPAAALQQHGAADGREDHRRNELVARADAEEVGLRAARDQIGS